MRNTEAIQDVSVNGSGRHASDFRKKIKWHIREGDEIRRAVITPERATVLLELNKHNRPVSQNTVSKYALEMGRGNWVYAKSNPITVSTEGVLINGQHRLLACLESGASFEVDLVFGEEPEVFGNIDIGDRRDAGDIFFLHGETSQWRNLAAAARTVWRYENTGMQMRPELEPDANELWFWMDENHPDLRNYVKKVGLFQDTGWRIPVQMVALNYICSRKAKAQAEEFFYSLVTGNDIGSRAKSHPINAVRNRLNKDIKDRLKGTGLSKLHKTAFIVKAWNAYRTGKPVMNMKWRGSGAPDESFPKAR